jgi:Protein of unknown function (DUF4012)
MSQPPSPPLGDDARSAPGSREGSGAPPTSYSGIVGVAAVVATLLGCLIWLAILVGPLRLVTGLIDSADHLRRGENALSNTKLRAGHYEVLAGNAAARRAKTALRGTSAGFDLVRIVPQVDDAWDDADHLARAAKQSATAARGSLKVARSSLRGGSRIIVPDPEQPGQSIVVLDRVEEIGGTITTIREHLQTVVSELEAVDMADLPRRARPRVADGIEEAADADEILADAEAGFELLPDFLGQDEPRIYLIGMQNSAEQRGTGGAILRYTYLSIDEGKPSIEKGTSVYDVDTEKRRQVDLEIPDDAWYVAGIDDAQRFGNANWSPDWPTSAELMLDYAYAAEERYPQDVPPIPDFDGVITVDPVVMEELIPGTGPFRVGTFKNRITGNNAVHFLLYKAYASYPRTKVRRGVLKKTVDGFVDRLLDPAHPTELVTGMGSALDTKHMFIWMKNPDEQAFIERMNWDAGIEKAKGKDYLYVVEQNVGGNKFDYHADNETTFDIALDDSDATVSTEMRVINDTYFPQPSWAVGDSGKRDELGNRRVPTHEPMMNLYVPGNSELTGWEVDGTRVDSPPPAVWAGGRPPEHEEKGKKVWSATLEIAPEEEGAVTFDYKVPGVVKTKGERNTYSLVVQHQPKVRPEMLDITLSLPDDAENIVAPDWERDGDDLVWSRPLERDMELEVSWR